MAGYIVPDIEAKELNGSDIAVWAALCRFAQWERDDNNRPVKSVEGSCYPSLQAITEKAHVAQSTVCESLKRLERLGYIERVRNGHNMAYTLYAEDYRRPVQEPEQEQSSDYRNLKFRQPEVKVPIAGSLSSDNRKLKFRQSETNNIYNNTINKPVTSGEPAPADANNFAKQRKASQRPYPGLPYDKNALGALTEMYELVPDYVPDPPLEVRFLQELAQEYPDADLFRQFRRARDWLINAPQHKRPKKDLRRFLRNWIANGERYGENQKPPDTRYEADAPMFVPLERDT